MVREVFGEYVGEEIEVVGVVSVRYDDSGRVVIGQSDVIVNGEVVGEVDHIGVNPNNFHSWNHGDHPFVERGDKVRVVGRVIEYVVKGNRNHRNSGQVNYRFDAISVFEIID